MQTPGGYAPAYAAVGGPAEDNPHVRSTADFWVETLRRRKQEQALRLRYEDLQGVRDFPASSACVFVLMAHGVVRSW
jgi:hypothetical protein